MNDFISIDNWVLLQNDEDCDKYNQQKTATCYYFSSERPVSYSCFVTTVWNSDGFIECRYLTHSMVESMLTEMDKLG